MATSSPASQLEKTRVFRAYQRGDASWADLREVFDEEELEDVSRFDSLLSVVQSTPTNEPSDDLFE